MIVTEPDDFDCHEMTLTITEMTNCAKDNLSMRQASMAM